MLIDRRQFLISNVQIEYGTFHSIKYHGCFIAYQDDCPVLEREDGDGNQAFFLGNAFSVDFCKKKIDEDISILTPDNVIDVTRNWAGRWILIVYDHIYTDAAGLMGLYYYSDDKKWIVSSSLHIIIQLLFNKSEPDNREILQDEICHSFPAPDTRFERVQKLFPSQCLLLNKNSLTTEYIDKFALNREKSYVEKIRELAGCIKNVVSNVQDENVMIALTCGYDSRVLLAALLSNKVHFSAYTMEHNVIKKNDSVIPKQMAARFGFPYRYIKKQTKPVKARLRDFDIHAFYSINEADRMFYACSQIDLLPRNALVLKGGILDLIRGSQYPHFSTENEMYDYIVSISPETDEYKQYNKSLKKWFDWVKDYPNDVDIRDRFAIEINLGGWLSNLQQSVDLLDQTFVQISNSAAIISLILSFTEEERKSKQIYIDLYKELYPEVLDFPINPKERMHMVKYYWYTIKGNPMIAFKKLKKKLRG